MKRFLGFVIALATVVAAQPSAWADASHQAGHDGHSQARPSMQAHGHWSAPAHARATPNPIPVSPASILSGAAIYRDNCIACHGGGGRGNGPASAALEAAPADLRQMVPTHDDGDLAWKITNGRGEMPGWEGVLTDDEIWHVVNYLRHLPRLASMGSEARKNRAAGSAHVH